MLLLSRRQNRGYKYRWVLVLRIIILFFSLSLALWLTQRLHLQHQHRLRRKRRIPPRRRSPGSSLLIRKRLTWSMQQSRTWRNVVAPHCKRSKSISHRIIKLMPRSWHHSFVNTLSQQWRQDRWYRPRVRVPPARSSLPIVVRVARRRLLLLLLPRW